MDLASNYEGLNRNASLFPTGVLYEWSVVSETDGTVVQEGEQWLNHGANAFEVDGLPPDKYQIQFTQKQVAGPALQLLHCCSQSKYAQLRSLLQRQINGLQPGRPAMAI